MIVGDICVEGDLKVTGVLKNGADKAYITQEAYSTSQRRRRPRARCSWPYHPPHRVRSKLSVLLCMVKHDDYITPFSAWEDVSAYIPRHLTLWEAFYGDGKSGAKKNYGGNRGIEPRTTSTLRKYHTTRPIPRVSSQEFPECSFFPDWGHRVRRLSNSFVHRLVRHNVPGYPFARYKNSHTDASFFPHYASVRGRRSTDSRLSLV